MTSTSPGLPSTSLTSTNNTIASFRSPMRSGVAAVLILLALGQLTGRIFSINSTNTLLLEQTLRTDLFDELKYLAVVAAEEGKTEDLAAYEEALQKEFRFDPAVLRDNPEAAKTAKAAKAKATRRWPIQARRDNWDDRKKELSTAALVKKVVGETKFRREDLVAELKYLAVLAIENNKTEDQAIYEQAIPGVLQSIANDRNVAIRKSNPNASEQDLVQPEMFDPSTLRDPTVVEKIKLAKEKATHHWPIELRQSDNERMQKPWGTAEVVAMAIQECNKQRPFLSGNDRSRWLTVRSLVEFGTYEVNAILENEPAWDSVDIVSHKNSDGKQRLYSSKPPLQATLVAAPYWVVKQLTGWTLGSHPFEVGRILLLIVNVIPLGFAWWMCAKLLDPWCENDVTYVVLVACICFATLLSTFAVALNNHLWGAISAVAACRYAVRCWQGSDRFIDFACTGFWAAFVFTCELPAAGLVAILGLLLLLKAPRPTWTIGLPSVVLVLAAYFGTNYLAHQRWSPPYTFGAGDVNTVDSKLQENWYDYDFIRYMDGKKVDSYWRKPDNPLDQGEASLSHYLIHATVGHHGILSLTPLLALTIPGLIAMLLWGKNEQRRWAIAVGVTTVACVVFYLFLLDTRQRNYGGTTSAFRQLMWLHPLWLIATLPVVERLLRSRIGTALVAVLAAFSILAASYPTWNPWTQTWIWNWMLWTGMSPMSS